MYPRLDLPNTRPIASIATIIGLQAACHRKMSQKLFRAMHVGDGKGGQMLLVQDAAGKWRGEAVVNGIPTKSFAVGNDERAAIFAAKVAIEVAK